jgi:hypothetical protein
MRRQCHVGLLAIFILAHPQCKKAADELIPAGVAIAIPSGTAILADGIASDSEWADARRVDIEVAGGENVEAWIKHDHVNLPVMFRLHNPDSSDVVFPEILIDANNDKSETWLADDWWFHVSGSDCESRGRANDFANCQIRQSDWIAEPNYVDDTPGNVELIEVVIPLAKAGLQPTRPFGLAFCANGPPGINSLWPDGAEVSHPSSWSTARLEN